ncbi:MAG: glycosyltransferase [Candidatus Omnitrophica bacterium]|nr:glycosyltransferase [Candidatus Omnitrophota bacterium]
MKILFFVYPSAFQAPGGGETLLLKTKEALEAKGIMVKLFDQWKDKLQDYDILHVFGSVKDCLGLMQSAKSLGVKIVLSPIFWSTFQRAWHEYGTLKNKLQMSARHMAKKIFPVFPSARRRMFVLADALAPNSKTEADQINRLFAVSKNKMHIVPCGVDRRFANADARIFTDKYGLRDFVLSVGRIEPRKNQLNLIKAMRGFGKQLVFIGGVVPGFEAYFYECKRSGDKNTVFIDHLEHEDPLFASAYAASSVFVLPGWFETPGLVALEAGLAGARLAVTEVGSTREYFKDYAEYFNPSSIRSIREAIEKSLQKKSAEELRKHIMDNFLWECTVEENIKIYKHLLQ